MKKSIFLFFAAILCAMSVSAKMVYLKPSDNWKEAGAIFYVWYWTGSGSGTAGKLNYVGLGGLYGYDIGNHTSFKFTRNKSTSNSPWTDNWGETGDLSYDSNKPCYNVVKWNESGSGLTAAPSAYIAGAKELMGGYEWSAGALDNKMTLSDGKWTLIKTIESIAKGDYEYKVTDGSWGWSLGNGSNNASLNIPAAGKYEVTFTYTPSSEKVSATATPIYSVTVNAGEGGNATGTGECKKGASVTINATALENYEFVNWTITNGTGTFANETEASTTFTPTSNATIQANFRSTLTYSLTVQGGTGIESVTGGNNNVTLGESYTISATPANGYKFVGWTADVDANAEIAEASNASTSVVVKNGSVVLTASATEFLSTLTTANAYNEGDAGLAIPSSTVSEIGVVTTANVTATPACVGYVFANWTLTNCERIDGGAANATSITVKSKGDGAAASVVANYTKVPTATVYFVNNKSWSTIKVYAWEGSVGENADWPGLDITANKETEKLGEFDVYSYTVNQGAHANLIFNDGSGDDSKKTNDYIWTDGKYYYMGANKDYAGSTKEEITTLLLPDPLATEVYLAGDMTEWGANKKEFKKATADATTASVTVNLTAKTYEFKLIIDGEWKGNDGTMNRGGDAVHEGGWSFDGGNNCNIVADIAGDYTFTWNLTDKKLTVTYPPLPKYTVTATAENGSVTGAGEYEQGSEATLVATPNAGYAFVNWKKGEEVVSSEASYTFTVTANTDLVAVFAPEETHEVTVSYLCNSNPIPGRDETTLAVGVTTPSTITAPAITNYKFDSWTVGTGVQAVDATANPIQITTLASGEYTLTANYTKIELTYTVEVPAGTEKCYIRGGFDGWDKFHEMELKEGETNIFTLTIDGATTEHKYKYACQASWDYKELNADGTDVADRKWKAMDEVKKWAKPDTYTIAGTPAAAFGTEWDAISVANIMRKQDDGTFVWSAKGLVLTTTTEVKFKVVKNQDWNTAWPSSDKVVTIPADGVYNLTIYFNAGEKDDESKNNGIYVNLEAATPDYTRDVRPGYYGTICLPNGGTMVGTSIFEIAYKDASKIYFDEIVSGKMEAGIPYIFLPNEGVTTLKVFYTEMAVVAAGSRNGLVGYYDNTDEMYNVPVGNYILLNNQYCEVVGTKAYIMQNYSYIVLEDVPDPDSAPALAPGARRVSMGMAGQNTATGMENIDASAQPVKTIINGQLYILRGEKMYDAQGKLVK